MISKKERGMRSAVSGASDGVTLKSIQRTDDVVPTSASASVSLDMQDGAANSARYNS